MVATYEDAQLVVQLVRWGTEMGADEAAEVIFSDGFDSESAQANDPEVRKLLGYGETIGTLVKQGILNRELVHDLWWSKGVWARVGPAALRVRERLGEPRLYENFEALAESAP